MATELESNRLEIPPHAIRLLKYDMRGHSIARAITTKGSTPWAVGPHTCHRTIMIRVYVKTSIQLYIFGLARVRWKTSVVLSMQLNSVCCPAVLSRLCAGHGRIVTLSIQLVHRSEVVYWKVEWRKRRQLRGMSFSRPLAKP